MTVSASPTLGTQRIGLRQDRAPGRPETPPTPLVEASLRLIVEMQGLRAEVIGLRADLRQRTLGARLARAWAWVRQLLRRGR